MIALDVGIISVVPSPYQRDLFRALSSRPEVDLTVYYLEASAPDSPWPQEKLERYERLLASFWIAPAGARFHVVTKHPRLAKHEFLVLNSLTSSVSQYELFRRRRGQRLFFWAEALRPQIRRSKRLVRSILTSNLRKVDAIVAIGSAAAESYTEQFPGKPVFNIPYHCDLASFLALPATFEDIQAGPRFLFCGQLIARKGVDVLLRAFDNLIQKGYSAELSLAGRRGELDDMLASVSPQTRAKIEYLGFIEPKRLHEIYARHHVFILPSRYDGWGVVVNQALGSGLPVICTTTVGAGRDLVTPEVNGFRVPPDDVEALANAMLRFAEQPSLAQQFGAASRTRAESITPDQGADKWLNVLSQFR